MLKLVITDGQYEFGTNDFGRDIPFKIYNEADTAFNFTGYTVVIKILDDAFEQALTDITPNATTPGSGTGTFQFSSTNKPSVAGYYYLEAQLTQAGIKQSTYAIRIYVSKSPE